MEAVGERIWVEEGRFERVGVGNRMKRLTWKCFKETH